jgi:hypothetical protein
LIEVIGIMALCALGGAAFALFTADFIFDGFDTIFTQE